jgi:arylsulfatase A-like enzyme
MLPRSALTTLRLCGLALPLLLAACGSDVKKAGEPRRGHGGRGFLVIAVDSLRADHMSYSGYDRETTPVIDALIGKGICFTNTWSASPEIIASHGGLLTGADPLIMRQPLPEDGSVIGLSRRWRIPGPAPSLAAEFLAAGYATAAFVDHAWLAAEYGFDRGFERFDDFRGGIVVDESDFGASQLGRRVLDWIRSLESDRDWFAYVDINDLERSMRHSDQRWNTYFPPRQEQGEVPPVVDAVRAFFGIPRRLWPGGQQTVGEYEASYDGFVRTLDHKIGRLLGTLDRIGRLEETTVCIIGTYGVGFGEAGLYLDHGTLADVDLAVPWVLKLPASSELPRGVFSDSLASTIDLMPTLLELAELPTPPGIHGRSQIPTLGEPDAPPAHEFVYSMGGVSDGFAVHDKRYSYQQTFHASRGDGQLLASWYGTPNPKHKVLRRYLRDRQSGSGPGDLEPPAINQGQADLMRAQGQDWYSWIEYARLAMHDPEWMPTGTAPEIKAELVSRGLISALD